MSKTTRLLYLVNVDWFFLSHRLPIALAAKEAGYDVWVAAADTGFGHKIREQGLKFIPLPMHRSATGLWSEISVLLFIFGLYRKIKPALAHHVTIKPVIYGSLVARFFRSVSVVNAVTGMGFVFSGDDKASLLKRLALTAYRIAFGQRKLKVIFQNESDRATFVQHKLVKPEKTTLIRGSGVDCNVFKPKDQQTALPEHPVILLASRMIRDKGIAEFAQAAGIVKKQLPGVRFVLAGMIDDSNPNAIPKDQLQEWQSAGLLAWLGHRDDMLELISQASIIALPTYYPEGVPKFLIEAAASGKPIITTNRPGCNDIVKHEINGLLIPERDSEALAGAVIHLLNNPDIMHQMGQAGRKLVLEEFDVKIVIAKTLALYEELLSSQEKYM